MKKVAVLLILFGSGLTVFGITGFGGAFSTNTRGAAYDQPNTYDGSFEWPIESRVEIIVGVISLAGGLLLRKDSK